MKTLIALLAMTLFNPAHAYDLSKKFGIGVSGGVPIPVWGNQFNNIADPEWGASVHGRYHLDPSMALDLSVSREAFKETSMEFDNINLMGLWRMAGAARMSPVFGLGAGVTRIEDYSPHNLKLSLLARGGVEYGLSPNLSLGALLDYQYVSEMLGDMPTNPAHVIQPQLALTFYFGGDSGEDMKEETPAKSDVVSSGQAATLREENKPDITVEFDTEKADIRPEFLDRIKEVADRMNKSNDMTSYIEGHADSTGPRSFNDKLSMRRADAVKQKLIEYGVSESRIRAEGFGEDRPIADNSTRAGRQANRRSAVFISIRTKLSSTM